MTIYTLCYEGTDFHQILQRDDAENVVQGIPPTWTSEEFTSTAALVARADEIGLPHTEVLIALGLADTTPFVPVPYPGGPDAQTKALAAYLALPELQRAPLFTKFMTYWTALGLMDKTVADAGFLDNSNQTALSMPDRQAIIDSVG